MRPLALELAGDGEEAAEVAGEHRPGAGGGDRGGLLLGDGAGDVGVLDAERAAEAAALFRAAELAQRQPGDRLEELARLALDAELAEVRAGVVVGHRAVEARLDG